MKRLEQFGKWHCPEHEVHYKERKGFVHLVNVEAQKKDAFVQPIANELLAVRPWERGLTAAILVRSNTFGEFLAAELRHMGVPCVWEGESRILDTPVLNAFTALLAIAEHPGDKLAYNTIRLSPLGKALYPGGMPPAVQVSRDALYSLTTRGLVRTFQEARAGIAAADWDEFTESRFAEMLRAAARFELTLKPETRLGEFIEYLQEQKKRGRGGAKSVRIMTIHHSKGLGFNYVLLPLYEHFGLDRAISAPLEGENREWFLPSPGKETAECFEATAKAYERLRDANIYESLCVYYVAMTRAMTALTLFIPPPPKTATDTTRFADFVRESALEDMGDALWYTHAVAKDEKKKGAAAAEEEAAPSLKRKARVHVRRRTPSLMFRSGVAASTLFESRGARKAAMERGTAVHAEFEKIEFIPADEARTPLETALVKPAGFVELWREKAYELFIDGQWESGQFDRVVFVRDAAGALRARVYDFKTNQPHAGEDAASFAQRMRETYYPQLSAYRRAVAALTGIAAEAVSAVLLLTATGEALDITPAVAGGAPQEP